jgi:hypothetical protein
LQSVTGNAGLSKLGSRAHPRSNEKAPDEPGL